MPPNGRNSSRAAQKRAYAVARLAPTTTRRKCFCPSTTRKPPVKRASTLRFGRREFKGQFLFENKQFFFRNWRSPRARVLMSKAKGDGAKNEFASIAGCTLGATGAAGGGLDALEAAKVNAAPSLMIDARRLAGAVGDPSGDSIAVHKRRAAATRINQNALFFSLDCARIPRRRPPNCLIKNSRRSTVSHFADGRRAQFKPPSSSPPPPSPLAVLCAAVGDRQRVSKQNFACS